MARTVRALGQQLVDRGVPLPGPDRGAVAAQRPGGQAARG